MNTVYILGAGFSAPFLPVQTKLLGRVLNFRVSRPKTRSDMEFIGTQETLREWFLEHFGVRYSDVWLEDVFTWLDHITSVPSPRNDIRAVQHLRRNLDFALSYYFSHFPRGAKERMVKRIHNMRSRSVLTGVITLNWDTLLERAVRPNYGLPVHTREGTRINRRSGPLLKLHGSVDWWRCTRCQGIVKDSSLDIFFEEQCPICQKSGTRFDAVLMTPTLMKNPNEGPLEEVWRLAFVLLSGADEIVFMGYSLPQADHALYHLVMQAKRSDAVVKAVLLEQDRLAPAAQRFHTLVRNVELNFSGIDTFLGIS